MPLAESQVEVASPLAEPGLQGPGLKGETKPTGRPYDQVDHQKDETIDRCIEQRTTRLGLCGHAYFVWSVWPEVEAEIFQALPSLTNVIGPLWL